MKKFLLLIMLVVLFMLFFLVSASASQWTDSGNVATSFSGGQGTKDDPYQISNAAELAYLSNLANAPTSMYDVNPTTDKYYVLTNDIDLSGHLWTPIGYDWVSGKSFQGYFDGNNHSVANMSIRNNGYWYQGLFGYFSDNSGSRSPIYIIKNLSVSGDITIDNADSNYFEVGGIVGSAGATLVNCHSSVNINVKNIGTSHVEYEYYRMSIGGLAGWCYRAINCSSSGYVNLEYSRTSKDDVSYAAVGGLLGTCRREAMNCYSTSDVEVSGRGRSYAGGLIGYCWNDWVVKVFNCYASGNVKAEGSIAAAGALIGSAGTKEIDMQCCYWDDAMTISPLNTINIIIGEGGNQAKCYSFTKGLTKCVVNMSQSINLVEILQSWVSENIEYSYYQWWDNEIYIEPYCDWKYSIDADENHGYPTFSRVTTAASYWTDAGITATSFESGSGTAEDPYLISTAAQLAYLSNLVNNGGQFFPKEESNPTYNHYYKLTADIDLSLYSWEPIGGRMGLNDGWAFMGYFDGNNKAITGLRIDVTIHKNTRLGRSLGLFGAGSGESHWIRDLNVAGQINVEYGDIGQYSFEVGGLIGCCDMVIISCNSDIDISLKYTGNATSQTIGGLVGSLAGRAGIIESSSANGSINIDSKPSGAGWTVGGMAGLVYGNMSDCSSATDIEVVSDTGINAGGLLGWSGGRYPILVEEIWNCYASGRITVKGEYLNRIAGLVADIDTDEMLISNCYSTSIIETTRNTVNQFGSDQVYGLAPTWRGNSVERGGYWGGEISLFGNANANTHAMHRYVNGNNVRYSLVDDRSQWSVNGTPIAYLENVLNQWVIEQNDIKFNTWRCVPNSENGGLPFHIKRLTSSELLHVNFINNYNPSLSYLHFDIDSDTKLVVPNSHLAFTLPVSPASIQVLVNGEILTPVNGRYTIESIVEDTDIIVLPSETYWVADSDFEYAMQADGSLIITKYIGNNPIVSIPSTFTNTDDMTTLNITEIGSHAFENNSIVTSVTIPTTITQIGDYAFKNCNHLRTIQFSETTGSSEIPADFGSISEIQKAEWTVGDGGTSLFPKSSTAKVMDIATRQVFNIKRWSGAYHADCVPLTEADTKTMCDIVGFTYNASHPSSAQLAQIIADTDSSAYTWPDFKGSWSGSSIGSAWDRRAALLNVNGQVYCVSIYGWPHGYSDIKHFQPVPSTNNYYGMMCIHFVGSYTHLGSVDRFHQAAIDTAYAYAQHYWPDLIKESQLTIGNYAFDGSAVELLQLPERVSTVGEYAFSNSTLSKIIIQNRAITISENAFQGSLIYNDGIYSYNNTAAKRYARNYLIPFHDLSGAPFRTRWVDNGIAASSLSGGTGTQNDPFLISNGAELGYLSKLVNLGLEGSSHENPFYYVLTNDIDLSAHEWVPIGAIEGKQFCGSFDGDGFTVKGMYINNVYECIGLFGMVSRNWAEGGLNDTRICNLSVSGEITISGFSGEPYHWFDIGCIAGQTGYCIENCHSNVIIDISSINNESPDISAYRVGGLVGSAAATSNCSSSGSIHINYQNSLSDRLPYLYIGGIASTGRYIRNCFSTVDISVDDEPSINSDYRGVTAGGIVGYGMFISNCYSAGRIEVEQKEGVNEVGNLVGFGNNGDPGILVSNSYWLEDAQVPNDANQDGVGYNGQDSEDCHTFSGNGTQWHIRNTQVSLVSSLNQWVTAQNNDQYLAWKEAASSQDNAGYPVLVSRLIDLGDAGISGIESDDVLSQGDTVTFVAYGVGMNNPDVLGYRRWRPYSWRTNPSGTWSSAPYSATFSTKGMSLGAHDLIVTLLEEEYAIGGWRTTGRSTTIVVPYTLVKKATLPETGDNATPALWLILCLISGAGLVSVLNRFRRA